MSCRDAPQRTHRPGITILNFPLFSCFCNAADLEGANLFSHITLPRSYLFLAESKMHKAIYRREHCSAVYSRYSMLRIHARFMLQHGLLRALQPGVSPTTRSSFIDGIACHGTGNSSLLSIFDVEQWEQDPARQNMRLYPRTNVSADGSETGGGNQCSTGGFCPRCRFHPTRNCTNAAPAASASSAGGST